MFPTRLQIKTACESQIPFESDIDTMIQEMQDRLYDAGVAIGSRLEIEVDLSSDKQEWEGYQVVTFSVNGYDGVAGVRDNEKPHSVRSWKVRDVEVEHQSPGGGSSFFIDHKTHEINGKLSRVYQLPCALETSDEILRFLMKMQSPEILLDEDQVRVRSIYVAKLGLLAIGYQNEGDPRSDQAMSNFLAHASQGQKRFDGVKQRFIGLSTGVRHRPTNRM